MIIGIDLGNYSTKSSKGINILSKVSKLSNILSNSTTLTTPNGNYYIEEGDFDTEYRKVNKKYIKELFLTSILLSSNEINNQLVVGLPLSQYKQDKDKLKQLLLSDRIQNISLNGNDRKLILEDIEIYPEGVGALVETEFNGVICDIGGLTTELAILENNKIKQPYSLSTGTLNLYSDFIKSINSKFSLDLKSEDATRILKSGLKIYGEQKDISFAMDAFKSYVENIVRELQVSYSIKTLDIMLVGGGSQLLYQAFKNRIPQSQLIDNSIFANAMGFEKIGKKLWR